MNICKAHLYSTEHLVLYILTVFNMKNQTDPGDYSET